MEESVLWHYRSPSQEELFSLSEIEIDRDAFVNSLTNYLRANSDSVLLTADLGFGVFDNLFKDLPQQIFNVGVAEQLMTNLAAGLAHSHSKVFTYSIGVFPTLRCLEQIRNSFSYHSSNVVIVTSGAGFSYGSLGITHHCTEDLG